MFRFLKGRRKADEAPAPLGIDDLPPWLDAEESRIRADLSARVAGHRPAVLKARGRMEGVLSGFDAASMEEVSSLKLAGVTERSLPLFLRAMRMSLSRDLPDDPEGFYTAAGEILKGCLSAFRGQGRYLASRFPAEMKVLRDGVDDIGREVNSLTPEVGRARERLRELAGLRAALELHGGERERLAAARNGIREREEEVADSRRSLEAAVRARGELEKGEDHREFEKELLRIRGLEGEHADLERRFREASATAIHLLRKGEKIASRRKDREALKAIRETGDLLEGGLPPGGEAALAILPAGQKALAAMAASGELVPKNREEIDLIERPGDLVHRITSITRRYREISEEMDSAQVALRARPVSVKRTELMKEAEELEKRLARAGEGLDRAREEVSTLDKRMQASLAEVSRRAEALSGRPLGTGEPDSAEAEGRAGRSG
ncbi:MAG: hypothetical protein ACM3X8_07840 [Methanomicrobiales archaeon]